MSRLRTGDRGQRKCEYSARIREAGFAIKNENNLFDKMGNTLGYDHSPVMPIFFSS